jgi:pimeloyl-ACP methyl ester carboxylesterase
MLPLMKKRYLIAGASGVAGGAIALKLLTRPRRVEWAEHRDRVHHAERSRFATVAGVRVHYQEAGPSDAPPVLLIHGFTASTLVWSEVLLPIAEAGFRVVAPDLMGFGFSEKPRDGEYTIEGHARMILGLMDELGIERATLVGSSYGGAIAATCALDYAERVERLVLVGAVSNDDVKRRPLLRLAASPFIGELISPLLLDLRWMVKRHLKRNAVGNTGWLDDKRIAAYHVPLRAADTQRAALNMLRVWSAERIRREAHLITQPTLLIWGEHDAEIPLSDGEHLHQEIPSSRLIVFRRCGHLPQEEYPREFTMLVEGFCKETLSPVACEPLEEQSAVAVGAGSMKEV